MKLTLLALTAAAAFAMPMAVWAQQPAPAKPPAKPAATKPAAPAAERTKSLGDAGTEGNRAAKSQPILTREELRACFKQEEAIRTRLNAHEQARAPIDAERTGLTAEQEALKAERGPVDAAADRAQALKGKFEAHTARVGKWNADVAAFNERQPSGAAGDRERTRLNTEREALTKAQAELEAERVAVVSENEKVVAAFNARARAVEAKVVAWNERNGQWNAAGVKLEEERKAWVATCADRRYREDDELAIKRGQ
jgi:hypothetical protein